MSLIEIIAVIFSLISVVYTVKKNIWSWISGIIGIVFYGIIFYQTKIYSNLFLQFLFIGQSIYGIYNWKENTDDGELKVETSKDKIKILLNTIFIFLLLRFVFRGNYKDMDAMTTSLSIVAMYLLSKRKIENWILWIIADIIYIYMFFIQGLYLSSLLYLVFLILCIIGYKKWSNK